MPNCFWKFSLISIAFLKLIPGTSASRSGDSSITAKV